MTLQEIDDFIADTGKLLIGDVEWQMPTRSNGQFRFRSTLECRDSDNHAVELNIWHNTATPTLTIAYFVAGIGRIYGFCLGVSHNVMRYHRHRGVGDNEEVTELPADLAQLTRDPAAVWAVFCAETSLVHIGNFSNPAGELWLPQSTEI